MKYITPPEVDIEALVAEFRQSIQSRTNNQHIEFKKSFADLKIDESKVQKPVIYLSMEAWVKMQNLVHTCEKEIAWHATVEKVPYANNKDKWYYFVKQVFVYPQQVTGTFVDVDPVKWTEWSLKLPDETFSKIRFQGHSHVNMGTAPSGTDNATYQNLLDQLGKDDFYIFMILNKRGEFTLLVYDFAQNIIFDTKDCYIDVLLPNGGALSKWTEENMKQVTEKPTSYQYNNYPGYYGGHIDDYDEYSSYHGKTTNKPLVDGVSYANNAMFNRNGHCYYFKNDEERAYFFLKHREFVTEYIPTKAVKELMQRLVLEGKVDQNGDPVKTKVIKITSGSSKRGRGRPPKTAK